jgi:hypothetical protein
VLGCHFKNLEGAEQMSSNYVPPDPDDGRYLLQAILLWVGDQVPERMYVVWADEYSAAAHPYRAVSVYNATVALEWGRSADADEDEDRLSERESEWSREYPDPGYTVQLVDVIYKGAVVTRLRAALVDGARCLIPFPESATEGGYQVTEWELAVVRLANELAHPSTDSLEYVKRAGIKTIDLPPPRMP